MTRDRGRLPRDPRGGVEPRSLDLLLALDPLSPTAGFGKLSPGQALGWGQVTRTLAMAPSQPCVSLSVTFPLHRLLCASL